MKKILTILTAAALCVGSASALPKAFYVKQGDKITKYNFGVAENLKFSNNGHTLSVAGYGQSINLDEIDYISFTAPLTEAMTPSAQKERLVKIGQEAYAAFDLHDQADVLNMVHDFFDSDYAGMSDEKVYTAPVEYYLPEEYYDVHKDARNIIKAMKAMMKGNAAAARVMKAATVDLYKIEDYYGIYTADKASESWKKTAADHFEMRFAGRDNSQYSLTLTGSADYTTWTTRDFDGRFPRTIDIAVKKGNTTLATARLSTVLVNRTSIDMTLDFDAAGYKVKNVLKVVDSRMDDNVVVTIKGKTYVTADSRVFGRNFVNYEETFDAIKAANGYYDDKDNWVDEDGSSLAAMFAGANATVDLMGQLQLRGIANNATKIYNTLDEDADPFDHVEKDGYEIYSAGKIQSQSGNTVHVTATDLDILGKQINVMNDHFDAGFYYDGEEKLQGYLGWDMEEDHWEYSNSSEEPITYGYTRIDGQLVSVTRDCEWNYETETYTYGPWYCYAYNHDNGESQKFPVDESAVFFPEITHHEYDIVPVMWFPDGTSFSFGDFFDEDSFTKLIDDYNDIINTYLSITGQEQDENK